MDGRVRAAHGAVHAHLDAQVLCGGHGDRCAALAAGTALHRRVLHGPLTGMFLSSPPPPSPLPLPSLSSSPFFLPPVPAVFLPWGRTWHVGHNSLCRCLLLSFWDPPLAPSPLCFLSLAPVAWASLRGCVHKISAHSSTLTHARTHTHAHRHHSRLTFTFSRTGCSCGRR